MLNQVLSAGAGCAGSLGGGDRWRPAQASCSREQGNFRLEQQTANDHTRAIFWLKVPTRTFPFMTLFRHYAKRALTR